MPLKEDKNYDRETVDKLIFRIMGKGGCGDHLEKMPCHEKTIFCAELLSQELNSGGLSNFFETGSALLYYEILDSLRVIGADSMTETLEQSKRIAIGDGHLTSDQLENIEDLLDYPEDWDGEDDPDWKKEIDKIDDHKARDAFEKCIGEYAISCLKEGLLTP